MKIFTIILFILCFSFPCFAQQKVKTGKPIIRGFTIDVPVQEAQKVCMDKHKARWENGLHDSELLGTMYRCSGKPDNGDYFFQANIFVKHNFVVYIRFIINQPQLCEDVNKKLENVPLCAEDDYYWHYCTPMWKVSTYNVKEQDVNVCILDILSTVLYENYI